MNNFRFLHWYNFFSIFSKPKSKKEKSNLDVALYFRNKVLIENYGQIAAKLFQSDSSFISSSFSPSQSKVLNTRNREKQERKQHGKEIQEEKRESPARRTKIQQQKAEEVRDFLQLLTLIVGKQFNIQSLPSLMLFHSILIFYSSFSYSSTFLFIRF